MAENLRLFVACPLPDGFISQIGAVLPRLTRLLPRSRFTKPESWQITLAFLGDTPARMVDGISDAIAESANSIPPIDCTLGDIGWFGRPDSATLHIEVSADPALEKLCRNVRHNLSALGIRTDGKRFRPHITLARRVSLGGADLSVAWPEPVPAHINEVILYRSILKPSGAEYTSLFTSNLGEPAQTL